MRILFQSNAGWSPQGYGVQVKGLLPHLVRMGHEVAVFAFYGLEGGKVDLPIGGKRDPLELLRIPHYPRFLDPYGNDAIDGHMADFEADVVITLMDTWVLDPRVYAKHNWLAWLPIDHDPIPEQVLARLPFMKRALPYSRFGEKLIRATGVPATYIPHGVDTSIFRPFPEDGRRRAKTALGFDEGDFVVGMVGANKGFPSRKGFPEAFQAFAELRESVPEARLYVHSHVSSAYGGPDLQRLAESCGIASYVRFPDQYQLAIGMRQEAMAIAYNAFDVLLQPSTHEGFGIPLIEAQACGTPVITTEGTSMTELVGEGGWTVAPLQKQLTTQLSWVAVPDVQGFADALVDAYVSQVKRYDEDGVIRRQDARAMAEQFDWKLIADHYWRPLLDQVAEEIGVATAEPARTARPAHPLGAHDVAELQAAAVAEAEREIQKAADAAGVAIAGDTGQTFVSEHSDGELVKFVLPRSPIGAPEFSDDWLEEQERIYGPPTVVTEPDEELMCDGTGHGCCCICVVEAIDGPHAEVGCD